MQLQTFAVTRALDFIFDDKRLEMVSRWVIAHIEGRIEIRGKLLKMPINSELGFKIIQKAYKYGGLNEEDHEMMKDTVFKGVKTDSTMRT